MPGASVFSVLFHSMVVHLAVCRDNCSREATQSPPTPTGHMIFSKHSLPMASLLSSELLPGMPLEILFQKRGHSVLIHSGSGLSGFRSHRHPRSKPSHWFILSTWEGTSELEKAGLRATVSASHICPHLCLLRCSVIFSTCTKHQLPLLSLPGPPRPSLLLSRPSSHSQSLLKPLLGATMGSAWLPLPPLNLAVACLQGPKSLVSPSVGQLSWPLSCGRLPEGTCTS